MTEKMFQYLVLRFLVRILRAVSKVPKKDSLLIDAALLLDQPRDFFEGVS